MAATLAPTSCPTSSTRCRSGQCHHVSLHQLFLIVVIHFFLSFFNCKFFLDYCLSFFLFLSSFSLFFLSSLSVPFFSWFLFSFLPFLFCTFLPSLSRRCTGCEAVLCGIEEQVSRANQYRESQLKVKIQVETEVRHFSSIWVTVGF